MRPRVFCICVLRPRVFCICAWMDNLVLNVFSLQALYIEASSVLYFLRALFSVSFGLDDTILYFAI